MSYMKILVTGGAGFIGSHFLKELKDSNFCTNDDVFVIDSLENGFKENVTFGTFFECDLKDVQKVNYLVNLIKPDLVVHFAAYISVPESVSDPIRYYSNNFIGSFNLINACVNNDVKKFIFSSTAAVYGVPSSEVVNEDCPLVPINPYGNSKKMVEELLRDVNIANPSFNYVVLRYFNVAGCDPSGVLKNRQKQKLNLIPIIFDRVKRGIYSVDIFGDDYQTHDGTCVRDYIHVSDLASAHLAVIPLLDNGCYTFNVGYGTGYSVLDVVKVASDVCGVFFKVNFVARRLGDPPSLVADSSKLRSLTNWVPKYDDLKVIVESAYDGFVN